MFEANTQNVAAVGASAGEATVIVKYRDSRTDSRMELEAWIT
jgi:hypothetical protein